MIDHIGLKSNKLPEAVAFYDAVLAAINGRKRFAWPDGAVYGDDAGAFLSVARSPTATSPVHVAIRCDNRLLVDRFYEAALRAGGRDNGAPGIRETYGPTYYAAFVLDPDGNNVEAVCHAAV